MIDGQDIRDVQQRSVRAAIGMVPQDTVLFKRQPSATTSVTGRWEATDAEVEEGGRGLPRSTASSGFSPKGYETEVGERGLKLSGGEKAAGGDRAHDPEGARRSWCSTRPPRRSTATPEKEIQDALDRVSKNRTHAGHRASALDHRSRR